MRTRWIVAAVLVVTGVIWIGQGLGIVRGASLMVDDVRWAIAGLALVMTGIVLGWTALRNRHRT
jgi:uncharacterized membrane protein YozB (DUF420 family)